VVFPVYYTTHIVGNGEGLGDLWWGRAISLSMLSVAILSPLLGGIADYRGLRKRFLVGLTALSIASVAMLGVLDKGMVVEGFVLVVLANFGMEGAMVFYNSYLPLITDRSRYGRVSSWGYGVGYIGSIASLLLAIPLVRGGHYGLTWLMVAFLFGVFSIPAFVALPADRRGEGTGAAARAGMKYTVETLRELLGSRDARRFLIAYFLYADGVATIIAFSSIFAATTMGFKTVELIFLYLVVQGSALVGAFTMARAVDTRGPRAIVSLALVLWCAVCIMAYFVTTKGGFWAVASVAGLGLGTIQAASRAFYAGFIPPGKESEYFGLYSLAGKSSSILGPLVFGGVSRAFQSQRPAIISVIVFFGLGLVLVRLVKGGGPSRTG
jgi:UMF1 family MFS transporter